MGNSTPISSCCVRTSTNKKSSDEPKPPKIESKNPEIFGNLNQEIIIHAEKIKNSQNPQKTETKMGDEDEDDLINDPFFRYQKGDFLGLGCHGVVYESMEINDGRFYACKFISCLKNERKKIALYLDRKILDLGHENLLQYREVAESLSNSEDLMIVSEMVSGGSLSKLLMNFKVFDEKICKLLTKQILEGLTYLNSNGFSHSNLKPNNILIEANGLVKLSDFFTISKSKITQSNDNKIVATNNICYLAPEIVLTAKKTIKSDIWSLGCIILELLTGNKPWGDQYNNINNISKEINKGNSPKIPESLSKTAQNFLKSVFEIDENKRPSAVELLTDPFVLEINEKQENIGDFGQLDSIKSLFKSDFAEEKEDKEFAMAKNAFYNKLYRKTTGIKNENNDERTGKAKNMMRESVLDIRRKNEEERKKYELELVEMFKENEEFE